MRSYPITYYYQLPPTMNKSTAKPKSHKKKKATRCPSVICSAFGRSKQHRFTIVVTTDMGRKDVELAILTAFAKRDPDWCHFNLLKKAP